MSEPTKWTLTKEDGSIEEWAALCSVEIGETAKGEAQVKSVKAYAATAEEAGRAALAEFHRLRVAVNTLEVSDG